MSEISIYTYIKEKDEIQCNLCPHSCIFKKNNDTGVCGARKREDNKLVPYRQNEITALNIDPVEKKPLYHFYPCQTVLSIGRNFCNLSCDFCQNYSLSQSHIDGKQLDSQELIELLKQKRTDLVAFTYDEPLMAYESVLEESKRLKKEGFKVIMVSNGVLHNEYFSELADYVDAWNIDLKSYDNNFYEQVCHGGKLDIVLKNIQIAYQKGHVEVTNLLINNWNDDPKKYHSLLEKLQDLTGKNLVYHISRYHPANSFDAPPTSLKSLKDFYNLAKNYFDYVYLGNISDSSYSSTYCPECYTKVIERDVFSTQVLAEEGKCPQCNYDLTDDIIGL